MSAFKIIVKPNCDIFVDAGGGEVFWGNAVEKAFKRLSSRQAIFDFKIYEQEMAAILNELDTLLKSPKGHAT